MGMYPRVVSLTLPAQKWHRERKTVTLPNGNYLPREYIVCGFEAENFEQLVTVAINKAVKYSGFWLEKHGLTMDVYSPEVYYNSSPEGIYMELWMPTSERC